MVDLRQSSTRPKAEENFARASEWKNDEAEGRGGLPFTSYDYVSGQSLGLGVVLGLGYGLGPGSGLGPFWKKKLVMNFITCLVVSR